MDKGDAKDIKPRGDVLIISGRHLARKEGNVAHMGDAHLKQEYAEIRGVELNQSTN